MICSIVIPVYNMEKYILRALSSIKQQSFRNFEVIIVDDGSTDQSAKLIADFIRDDVRFSYYYFNNGGLGRARNRGLALATGKYVTFLDADDWLDDNYLEDCNLISKENEIIIQSRRFHHFCSVASVSYKENPSNFFRDINVSCTNKIFVRKFIEHLKFSEDVLYEDFTFHLSVIWRNVIFKNGSSFYNVEKRNENSITSSITSRHLDLLLNLESSSDLIHRLDRKTCNDCQVYSFFSSLYLISKFKLARIPVWRDYSLFSLGSVLKDRHFLRMLLFAALLLPRPLWILGKRLKSK